MPASRVWFSEVLSGKGVAFSPNSLHVRGCVLIKNNNNNNNKATKFGKGCSFALIFGKGGKLGLEGSPPWARHTNILYSQEPRLPGTKLTFCSILSQTKD